MVRQSIPKTRASEQSVHGHREMDTELTRSRVLFVAGMDGDVSAGGDAAGACGVEVGAPSYGACI